MYDVTLVLLGGEEGCKDGKEFLVHQIDQVDQGRR